VGIVNGVAVVRVQLNTSPLSAARFLINDSETLAVATVVYIFPSMTAKGKYHRAQGKQRNQVLCCFVCQMFALSPEETPSERGGYHYYNIYCYYNNNYVGNVHVTACVPYNGLQRPTNLPTCDRHTYKEPTKR